MKSPVTMLAAAVSLSLATVSAHAVMTEVAINGGFETGDFTGWEQLPGGGIQSVISPGKDSGFAAFLSQPSPAANLLRQNNLRAGDWTPGQAVTVAFDYRGSALAGGVLFAELFTVGGNGGITKSELLGGAPLFPDADPLTWKTFSINTTVGPDVANGISLSLNASCGADANCVSEYFIDNVSITADLAPVPVPAAVWLLGSGLLGLIGLSRRKSNS